MGQLRKISGSTLLESLIASVLIVIIFMVSSLILNNIINSKIKNDTSSIDYFIKKTEYNYINNKITLPYSHYENDWLIKVVKESVDKNDLNKVIIKAEHTKREVTRIEHFYAIE